MSKLNQIIALTAGCLIIALHLLIVKARTFYELHKTHEFEVGCAL